MQERVSFGTFYPMQVFQHYEVKTKADGSLWELGRGAMGVNYLAKDTLLDRDVALKVVNAESLGNETARLRFQREARAAARINHENVALVYQFGEEDGQFFYAMEFVRGETVEQRLQRTGPLQPSLAVQLAIQVCNALGAAHKEGLVHRDIKPANLMLTESDDGIRVKVIDFGLAKATGGENPADATLTVAGFVGTPYFASPEQLQEQPLDIRSDLYSLGVTLWFMLAANPPFGGTFANLLVQHLHGPPPLERLRGLPEPLLDVLDKALKKDSAERFQTPAEFRVALENCLPVLEGIVPLPAGDAASQDSDATMVDAAATAAATLAAKPPAPPPPPPLPPPENNKKPGLSLPVLVGIAVLVLAALGALGAWLLLSGQETASPPIAETSPESSQSPAAVVAVPEAAEEPDADESQAAKGPEPTPEPEPEPTPEPTREPTPDPVVLANAAWEEGQHEEQQGRLTAALRTYLDMMENHPDDKRPSRRIAEIFSDLEEQRVSAGLDTPVSATFAPFAQEAASAGIENAMILLGNGSLSSDPGEAAKWFVMAAEKNNPIALNQLGLLYSNGRGVGGVDAAKSMELFEKSSDLGNAAGKLYLADARLIEEGAFASYFAPERAVELLRESAAMGEGRAMRKLGFLFDKGIGVEQNDLSAFQWYEKAWESGLPRAAADLGVFYMNGRGLPSPDQKRGAELFAEGAAAQDPLSMTFYACCLFDGIGVKENKDLAKQFFAQAAALGEERAVAESKKRGISLD